MHKLPWPGGGEGMHQARLSSIYTCTLCATEEELTFSTWVVSASKPNSAPTKRGVHQGVQRAQELGLDPGAKCPAFNSMLMFRESSGYARRKV